jgi:hypothetical protein
MVTNPQRYVNYIEFILNFQRKYNENSMFSLYKGMGVGTLLAIELNVIILILSIGGLE